MDNHIIKSASYAKITILKDILPMNRRVSLTPSVSAVPFITVLVAVHILAQELGHLVYLSAEVYFSLLDIVTVGSENTVCLSCVTRRCRIKVRNKRTDAELGGRCPSLQSLVV